jgi:hypothetical protein
VFAAFSREGSGPSGAFRHGIMDYLWRRFGDCQGIVRSWNQDAAKCMQANRQLPPDLSWLKPCREECSVQSAKRVARAGGPCTRARRTAIVGAVNSECHGDVRSSETIGDVRV